MMNIELVEIKHLIQTEDMDVWNYKDELTALIDESIDRQTVKSEEVQEAITTIKAMFHCNNGADCDSCPKTTACNDSNERHLAMKLAIAALQEYQPWVRV